MTDSKMSATKKFEIGEQKEDEDPVLQPKAESSKIDQLMIIEVVSTLQEQSLAGQSEPRSMEIDDDPFKKFMEIKQKGLEIK